MRLEDLLFDVDWRHVFVPDTPLVEIFVRGTVMYLALFLVLIALILRPVGFFFRNNTTTTNKTELLIFITPRIVNERLTIR